MQLYPESSPMSMTRIRARRASKGFTASLAGAAGSEVRGLCYAFPARNHVQEHGPIMPQAPVIQIENLVVRYRSFTAVDGLDLELRAGELFGLLGPNGAGKSSTLRVLIGQRPPSAGRVSVFGQDLARHWAKIKP